LRLCWCEQSGIVDDRRPLIKALRDNEVDYYRYNWRHGCSDPYANVGSDDRLSWSMGRSLLYEHAARGDYHYYIFADDDVLFDDPPVSSIGRLRRLLDQYRPLTACLASGNWHDEWRRRIPARLRAPVHPFLLADLEVQILSRAIARETFPCLFDGGWETLWYPNVAVGTQAPRHQLQFNAIRIGNGRCNASGNYGGTENERLAARIRRVTINSATPRIFRAATKRYGVHDTARFANACFSLRRAKPGVQVSDRAWAYIARYFDQARTLSRQSDSK
jgi:hypothetical protein